MEHLHCAALLIYRLSPALEFLVFKDLEAKQYALLHESVIDDEQRAAEIAFAQTTGIDPSLLYVHSSFRTETRFTTDQPRRVTVFVAYITEPVKMQVRTKHFSWMGYEMVMDRTFRTMHHVFSQAADFIEKLNEGKITRFMKRPIKMLKPNYPPSEMYPQRESFRHYAQMQPPFMPRQEFVQPYGFSRQERQPSFSQVQGHFQNFPPARDIEERCNEGHPLYKTRLCDRWIKTGNCHYGPNCMFAHGEDDLRNRDLKRKRWDRNNTRGSFPGEDNDAASPRELDSSQTLSSVAKTEGMTRIGEDLERFFDAKDQRTEEEETKYVVDVLEQNQISIHQLLLVLVPALFMDSRYVEWPSTQRIAIVRHFLQTREDEVEFLRSWGEYLTTSKYLKHRAARVFKWLYDNGLASEDAFLDWYEGEYGHGREDLVKNKAKPLIDWLDSVQQEVE